TRAAGLEHVAFRTGELATLEVEGEFDALVGRWVLMYLPDPAAALRGWLRFVRSGGLVIFQESEMSMARSVPHIPLFPACGEWIRETFRRAGFEPDMGSRLFRTFVDAGLAEPEMILEGRIQGGSGQPVCDLLADTIRSLLPLIERLGVASAAALQVDTLAA